MAVSTDELILDYVRSKNFKVIKRPKSISKDTKKSEEERNTAKDVLGWIKDVRKTWNKDNSLHPNAVTKLMKITAIRQGRWGWSVPGGKVPKDFRRS